MLKVAPMLYALVGLWVYSNQQVFKDNVEPVIEQGIFTPSHHQLNDLVDQITPGTVFFIYPVFLLLSMIMSCVCRSQKDSCYTIRSNIDKIQVEQKLPNYFSALRTTAREALIREEVQYFHRLNFSRMSKETLSNLVKEPKASPEDRLTGDQSYRILWHP